MTRGHARWFTSDRTAVLCLVAVSAGAIGSAGLHGSPMTRPAAMVRPAPEREAREAHLAQLLQARRQSSVDEVLMVAERFLALGDRAAVERCLRIAERLAARDPEALADIRAFVTRMAGQ